ARGDQDHAGGAATGASNRGCVRGRRARVRRNVWIPAQGTPPACRDFESARRDPWQAQLQGGTRWNCTQGDFARIQKSLRRSAEAFHARAEGGPLPQLAFFSLARKCLRNFATLGAITTWQ